MDALEKPQFLTIDMDLNFNKVNIIIASQKTLPPLNIIILISFLTSYSLSSLKKFLISRFKSDNEIYNYKILDILFSKTEIDLNIFQSENEIYNEKQLIERYI